MAESAQPELDSEVEDEKLPLVDPTLTETEHTLLEYVSLLNKGNILTAIH